MRKEAYWTAVPSQASREHATEVDGKTESRVTTGSALVISLRDASIILVAFIGIFLALILVLRMGGLRPPAT